MMMRGQGQGNRQVVGKTDATCNMQLVILCTIEVNTPLDFLSVRMKIKTEM
jgi:hypothetical protein